MVPVSGYGFGHTSLAPAARYRARSSGRQLPLRERHETMRAPSEIDSAKLQGSSSEQR